MKKIIYILLMLPLLTLFNGCDDNDNILFDHELPQFEIKDNAILLEMIMPKGSVLDDEYYIYGPFNGGEDAIGNLEWKLEKAANSDLKWGIYLLPSSFVSGKTLADGFTFYAKRQGGERSVKNETVTHTLDVAVGTRTNVWVDRWENYFGEVEKNSYSIYINNQSDWTAMALYAWYADVPIAGDWPGLQPTGTEVINNVTYTVFDMGENLKGASMNLILNNNNGGKQLDLMQEFELNRDVYILFTGSSYEEVDPNVNPYSGYTVYVEDNSGWEALALYAWGDGDVTPGWPGLQPTGTKVINGVTYTYFEWGEALNGMTANMIFNNNGGGEQFDAIGGFVIERDVYLQITANSYKEVDPNGSVTPEGYTIYVEDNSGWDALAFYYWGDGVADPGWPGVQPGGTKDVDGTTYTYFVLPIETNDKAINPIFNNNNNDEQFDGPNITMNRDYYFRITSSSCEEIVFRVYAEDLTGWEALALYGWGDASTPDWPGLQPAGTAEIGGNNYTYFEMGPELTGKAINLIFNNNGAGEQLSDIPVTLTRDFYFQLNAGAGTEVTN